VELSRLIEALSGPDAYPHAVADVEIHHTHISVVFLAGDFAYKVKKPVRLSFLDYGTLARRRHYCDEEVRLNRRLAPDVYLGVVPIVELDGTLHVRLAEDDDRARRMDGHVVEWAVRMRRLPHERTLQSLVEREEIRDDQLGGLAVHLAEFHRRAGRGAEVARFGRFDLVAKNARDNVAESKHQVGTLIHASVFERLSARLEESLGAMRVLIDARAGRGVPCDSHGDLRLDHVYFVAEGEPPTIVDCIEFNPAFRFADPVADMAFLAMDLQKAGRWDLAAIFSEAWFQAANDEEGRSLLDFYVAYRAAVRGKVQGIKASAQDVPAEERSEAARTATGHWLLALGALEPPGRRPALVLVGGLPGTGKTTLATALAERAGLTLIRSDVVRKELAGLEAGDRAGADWGEGIYTEEWSRRTYDACLSRAEEALFRGGRVVVDASFHGDERRRAFLEVGARLGTRVAFLVCEAPDEVAESRLDRRRADASDADRRTHAEMARRWEPAGTAVKRAMTAVATASSPAATLEGAADALRGRGML
jgi:uncharacterized protein